VACALRFRYPEAEAGRTFQVTLSTLDPQIEPVGKPSEFKITPRLGEYHVEGGHGTYTVAGAVTLAVESAGIHSISITIDGAVAGDIPFQVLPTNDE
jgi:hypothetical protein